MQFMIIRKADAATEALLPPAPGLVEDMARFHRQFADEGRLGLALGLRPSAHAVHLKTSWTRWMPSTWPSLPPVCCWRARA